MIPQSRRKISFINKYRVLILVLAAIIAVVAISIPIRSRLSENYIKSGDSYLLDRKYVSAVVEYKKAKLLKNSERVEEKITLTNQSQKDILALKLFIREQNDIPTLESLAQAEKVRGSAYDSVAYAKELIEQEEPQIAIVAVNIALEMNKKYRDAWLYLGISHLECLEKVELSAENRQYHIGEAKSALERAKQLDPTYEPTLNFLNEVEKIN
jgi:tetratricopeptide (TPR) repeat protein